MSLTDSQTMLEFKPEDLSVVKKIEFSDKIDQGKIATGSAHAFKRGDCMIGIDPQADLGGKNVEILVYEMCPSNKDKSTNNNNNNRDKDKFERKVLNSYNYSYIPYCHSFGLSENYVIVPHQGLYFDYTKVLRGGKPLVNATVDVSNEPLVIKILPLTSGEEVITMTLDLGEPFYYFHFINSFEIENGDAVVMDLSLLNFNMLPYFTVPLMEDKSARDAGNKIIVKRFTMWIKGDKAGQWEVTTLSNPKRSTDFPNFNRAYTGKPTCFYFALEWFHNDQVYADMAVVKQNSCTGEATYWYKDNFFPSEPTFIPAIGSTGEDEGVLLFTAVRGATKTSYLEIVNAKDMSLIQEVEIPGIITFTTHGEWFPSTN